MGKLSSCQIKYPTQKLENTNNQLYKGLQNNYCRGLSKKMLTFQKRGDFKTVEILKEKLNILL